MNKCEHTLTCSPALEGLREVDHHTIDIDHSTQLQLVQAGVRVLWSLAGVTGTLERRNTPQVNVQQPMWLPLWPTVGTVSERWALRSSKTLSGHMCGASTEMPALRSKGIKHPGAPWSESVTTAAC